LDVRGLFSQEGLRRRKAALEAFEAWEAQVPPETPPEGPIARLDALRNLLPADFREPRAAADYQGVRLMHEALAALGRLA
jgi:hypothetical protein